MKMHSHQKLSLDKMVTYQIKVPAHLDERWSDWIGDLLITSESDEDGFPITTMTGSFDQASLHGLLRRLYTLGLPLISVQYIPCD